MWWTIALKWIVSVGKKIPWQVYACTGLVLAFWFWGRIEYQAGKNEVQIAWDASIKRGKGIVAELKEGQNKVTVQVETKYVDKIKVIHDKGATIVKEIPVYLPSNLPDLPPSFRVLYDAAATNTIPEATSLTHAASVPVTDVATGTVQNFTQYYQVKAQLEGLQQWVRDQYQLYLDRCKQPDVHCTSDSS